MILKNSNNDTCLSDVPIAGWVEISEIEFNQLSALKVYVPSLSDEKAAACARIDAAAIAVDNKYLTCGGQQGQVYAQKMAQAIAYKQAAYPALADPLASTDQNYALYGYVRAERDAMRVSAPAALDKDAADTIIAQSNLYALSIGIQRESLRRNGKEQVMVAAVSSAISTAESAAIAALRAL